MTIDEILDLDATAQRDVLRSGDATAAELVDAAIARIEAWNPRLNAVIHRMDDTARSAASGVSAGAPFAGVPMLVKDGVCHTAGDPFHCGMRVLRDIGWTEREDAWLAQRFRRAGFVFVGKTNLPELASSVTTEPLAYGPTANPWSLDRSPGGSSGGSAAAVAARMVAVAHGNDMGGSIRFPASMCGLVGLKPTRARTTLGPAFGEYWGPTTHEFVLVRSVRDAAAILDCVAGAGVGDPYTAPAPTRPFVEELGVDPGPLRIAVGERRSHPDCDAAVGHTVEALEALGHHVERVPVDWLDEARPMEALAVMFPAFIARDVERWSQRIGREIRLDELEPNNAAMVDLGRTATAVQWQAALEGMQSWSRDVARRFVDDYDLLLTPTVPDPPKVTGSNDPVTFDAVTYTIPFNLTGQPAISLPVHWNDEGLPIGVQFVAPYGREDWLFQVSAQLESVFQWSSRRPPSLS
jgi:amidase